MRSAVHTTLGADHKNQFHACPRHHTASHTATLAMIPGQQCMLQHRGPKPISRSPPVAAQVKNHTQDALHTSAGRHMPPQSKGRPPHNTPHVACRPSATAPEANTQATVTLRCNHAACKCVCACVLDSQKPTWRLSIRASYAST